MNPLLLNRIVPGIYEENLVPFCRAFSVPVKIASTMFRGMHYGALARWKSICRRWRWLTFTHR